MNKAVIAVLLSSLSLCVLSAADTKSPELSPLAQMFAAKREKLLHNYADKRKAMLSASDWQQLSADEQKKKLDALTADAKKKDDALLKDYDARRKAMGLADEVRARQNQQDWLDQIRVQAIQSSRKANGGH